MFCLLLGICCYKSCRMFLWLLRYAAVAFATVTTLRIYFCWKHLVYTLTVTPGEKWHEENIIIVGTALGCLYRNHALIEKHERCRLQKERSGLEAMELHAHWKKTKD